MNPIAIKRRRVIRLVFLSPSAPGVPFFFKLGEVGDLRVYCNHIVIYEVQQSQSQVNFWRQR